MHGAPPATRRQAPPTVLVECKLDRVLLTAQFAERRPARQPKGGCPYVIPALIAATVPASPPARTP
jgi:hypothetical protein